jgi:hypothetical protein
MPDVSGASAVNTRVHTPTTKRTRGCGCIGHPAFPAPSYFRGTFFWHNSGSSCREIEDTRQRSCRGPSFETPRTARLLRTRLLHVVTRSQTLMARRRIARSRTMRPPVGNVGSLTIEQLRRAAQRRACAVPTICVVLGQNGGHASTFAPRLTRRFCTLYDF